MAQFALTQIRWARAAPTGDPARDVAINAIHWGKDAGSPITDTDRATFETAFLTFFGACGSGGPSYISNAYSISQFRHYDMPTVAGPLGAPALVNNPSSGNVGTGTTAELPPQISASITMRTAVRRRWGRIYLPGVHSGRLDHGKIDALTVDVIGGAFHSFVDSLRTSFTFGVVVWHRGSWAPEVVTAVSMDDVWDVQRRRRLQSKTHLYEAAVP